MFFSLRGHQQIGMQSVPENKFMGTRNMLKNGSHNFACFSDYCSDKFCLLENILNLIWLQYKTTFDFISIWYVQRLPGPIDCKIIIILILLRQVFGTRCIPNYKIFFFKWEILNVHKKVSLHLQVMFILGKKYIFFQFCLKGFQNLKEKDIGNYFLH